MAQDTFLTLVTNFIMETGIHGGNAPSSVAAATGDAAKVVYWIKVADQQLQRERIDFDFLWNKPTVQLTQDSNVVPHEDENGTNIINAIAKKRLAVINANGEPHFPEYMKWDDFSIIYDYEAQEPSDFPSYWSIRPDRVIVLSEPISSAGMNCKYEYWRKPSRLTNDNDKSRIPDDFDRLIILLAKILYAEHEDAPEVDAGSSAHYEIMFNQMLSVHAPEAEWQRMENSDQFMTVETR